MLEKALDYLRRGVCVIPQTLDRKTYFKWTEFQTRLPTEDEVRDWWTKYPEANIAIVFGKISNLTVVDFDREKDPETHIVVPGGKSGDRSKYPETDIVISSAGGFHYYYLYDSEIKNGYIAELTEIKNDGCLITAPPSKHWITGEEYKVYKSATRIPFPREIIGLQVKRKKDWETYLGGVSNGARNVTASRIIGGYLSNLPKKDWETLGWEFATFWNSRNDPPVAEYELRNVFKSIARLENSKQIKDNKLVIEKVADITSNRITFSEVLRMGKEEILGTRPEDVVSFGYDFLDDKLTGFFPGDLIIIGGETGTGKTTMAMNTIYKASVSKKCYVFALEDRLKDYGVKALYFEIGRIRGTAGMKNYPWNDYRKNTIKDSNFKNLLDEAERNLQNGLIEFFPSGDMVDADTVCGIIKRKKEEGVEIFLIDHLHYFDLLKGDSSKADYIEQTMIKLKTIQNKIGARILMIVHYKKLDGKKPTLDSFKDSISIVQNANYVINLWRDRKEGANQYETKLFCPKSRNPNGEFTLDLTFDPNINDYKKVREVFGSGDKEQKEVESLDLFNK